MFIQPLAMINCRKPQFTAAPRKEGAYYNPNDRVTIQDLYDSEDRIMEHQSKLIKSQNVKIAKTLNAMANYVTSPDEGANDRFSLALTSLIMSSDHDGITAGVKGNNKPKKGIVIV